MLAREHQAGDAVGVVLRDDRCIVTSPHHALFRKNVLGEQEKLILVEQPVPIRVIPYKHLVTWIEAELPQCLLERSLANLALVGKLSKDLVGHAAIHLLIRHKVLVVEGLDVLGLAELWDNMGTMGAAEGMSGVGCSEVHACEVCTLAALCRRVLWRHRADLNGAIWLDDTDNRLVLLAHCNVVGVLSLAVAHRLEVTSVTSIRTRVHQQLADVCVAVL